MAIKRYYATKDSTITDAYKADLNTRATGSNAGLSDIIEVFSIYGQVTDESVEKSRVLLQFDATKIKADQTSKDVPSNAKYYLKLFNAEHGERLPRNFELTVKPITSEWDEGEGLDLLNYTHEDESNWDARKSDRVAQVIQVSNMQDLGAANYSDHYIALFDGQNDQYNFFFQTAAGDETASGLGVGTDVAVNLKGLGDNLAATVMTKLQAVVNAHDSFTASIADSILTITNSLGGAANDRILSNGFAAATVTETVAGVNYTPWTTAGGDYEANAAKWSTQTFDKGTEDLEVDITTVVGEWNSDARANHGLALMLSVAYEDGRKAKSFYTKRFFARGTQFHFKQPVIEARWDASIKDDKGRLVTGNPHLAAADNTYNMYYYNWVSGALKDFPKVDDADVFPKFALTTDTALAQEVTLATNANSVVLSDSPNEVTQNSNARVKILDTTHMRFDGIALPNKSAGYFNLFAYDTANALAHTYKIFWQRGPSSPASLLAPNEAGNGGYYKDAANSTDTITKLFVRVGPWNEESQRGSNWDDGTSARRAHSIQNLTNAINGAASDHFHAVADGDSIIIYTRDAAAAGNNELMRWYKATALANHVEVKSGASGAAAGTFGVEGSGEITAILADLGAGAVAGNHRVVSTIFAGTTGNPGAEVTATKPATGTYKASFLIGTNISGSVLYERWKLNGELLKGHSGNCPVGLKQWYEENNVEVSSLYSVKIMNLKEVYSTTAQPRLKLFVRQRNSAPNMVSKNLGKVSGVVIPEVYYSLHRVSDNFNIIPYGTGSENHTLASYNEEGNYFDLDMGMLEADFSYGLKFMFIINGQQEEQPEVFKFRVEKKIDNRADS